MKSNAPTSGATLAGAERDGSEMSRERPITPSTAWVSSTAVRNETSVPMPST